MDIEAKHQLWIEAEQHVRSLMGSIHAAIAYSESPDNGPAINLLDHDPPSEQGPSQHQCIQESSPSEEDTVRSSLMPVDDSNAVHSFSYYLPHFLHLLSSLSFLIHLVLFEGLIHICILNPSFLPSIYQL
ncbi:uncharacterized protein ARMOST_16207 [Armillaria ostoyae]|uniref:Uncharacterized protein n=1 Tax=Armillaria ostoyae TaxID=47428 RepID=A0A284RVI6_ARMOS|nr:uncharacterized protein ARMOST_16207 [Armillaria ostoyae]